MRRLLRSVLAVAVIACVLTCVAWMMQQPRIKHQAAALAPKPAAVAKPISPALPETNAAAAMAMTPASTQGTARLTISSAWQTDAEPAMQAFAEWTARYAAAATPEARAALLAKGMALAQARREKLATWIRMDPQRALAAAVPVRVRRGLPAEILNLLEERVAGAGELALIGVTPQPGSTERPVETVYRSALIHGQEYRAYTYGRRDALNTLPQASLSGIAIQGALAVSDSPVRVLEAGEMTTGSGATAIEVNGQVEVLAGPEEVLPREAELVAAENGTHEVVAGNNLPGSSGVVGRPAQAWTHGTKKILIIRVQFSDLLGTPVNPADSSAPITDVYAVSRFSSANGVSDFYARNSFGKTAVTIAAATGGDSPDVTAVLTMPQTAAYYAQGNGTDHYSSQLHSDARAAATSAGMAVDGYDRIGVVFSDLSHLPASKLTYGGLGTIEGKNFWINGYYTFAIVAHELGHNYGLQHANLWRVTDGNPISATGTSDEYGDSFDVMGNGTGIENDFSHWNKSLAQWIPDSGVAGISSSGTYRVYRFDDPGANLANALALKVVRNRDQDYWIGLRRGTTNASIDSGAYVLWGYNDNGEGANLLDLTNPVNDTASAALAVGATFTDSVAGITLHPVAQGGSGADEWLDVQVTLQPRISWAQEAFVVDEQGGTATLTLTRESNPTGSVSVTYTTGNGTATAPADYTTTSGTVTWASGDQTPKTITIPIVADALVEGSENFTVTLSGLTGGAVLVNGAAATVTIADPGARDTTFTPGFVNSTVTKVLVLPDGTALLGGYFGTIQASGTNYPRGGITRMNADGTLDPDFAEEGGFGVFTGTKQVKDIARQPDGKLVVIGSFTTFNGQPCNQVLRLNADGTLDTSFNIGTGPSSGDNVNALLVQPDGKILLGGSFSTFNGSAKRLLVRLNANGSVDTGFTPPSFAGVAGEGWRVESLAMLAGGKALVGGSFYFSGSPFKASLCRIDSTGAVDTTFNGINSGAHVSGSTGNIRSVSKIEVEMGGSLFIAGSFTAFNGTDRQGLARLTSTGALDAGFNPTLNGTCNTLLLQPDGRLLIGGSFTTFNGSSASRLVRVNNATGAVETTFTAAGGAGGTVNSLALQADGKVLLGGDSMSFQGAGVGSPRPFWRFFGGLPGLPGTVQFNTETVAGIEGSSAVLSVTRTGGSSGAISVGYTTVAGTAGSGDFTSASGTLTWTDGDAAAKTITVPITADASAESAESFVVCLGQPLRNSAILAGVQRATVNVSTAFDAWRTTYFTPLEAADSNISGDLADPDGDGIANLLEFAFGLSPTASNGLALAGGPQVQNVGGTNYLTVTFKRRSPALDLTYVPQTNDNLPGTWLNTAVQVGTPVSNGDGTETVTYRDSVPVASGTRRFMRVQVTRVP